MLVPCPSIDVSQRVYSSDPDVLHYHEAIYRPVRHGETTSAGLYDRYGRLIAAGALHRGESFNLPAGYQTLKVASAATTELPIVSSCVWGGLVHEHYGHFLIETLPRLLLASDHLRHGRKILLASGLREADIFSISWMRDLLLLAGIHSNDIIIPPFQCRILDVIVPESAFCDGGYIHTTLLSRFHALGAQAVQRSTLDISGPVYLSRTGIRSGTYQVDNEPYLLDKMAHYGVRHVDIQTLNVIDQAALFAKCTPIGFVGSSFHNSIFSPCPRGLALFSSSMHPSPRINPSYALLDQANSALIDYYEFFSIKRDIVPPGFTSCLYISDVPFLALAIEEWIGGKLPQNLSYTIAAKSSNEHKPSTPFTIQDLKEIRDHLGRRMILRNYDGLAQGFDEGAEHKLDTPILIVIKENTALLVTNDERFGAIWILDHPMSRSPYFEISTWEDGVTLRDKRTGLFLSSKPSPEKSILSLGVAAPSSWEKFQIMPLVVGNEQEEHLQRLLTALNQMMALVHR